MKTPEERRIYCREWHARNKDKVRAAMLRWKAKNPEKAKARNTELMRKWREANRERVNEIARASYARNREKIRARNLAWRREHPGSHRLKRYGVDFGEWNRLFASQGYGCAICGSKKPKKNGWQMDHDHVTGRVRGILCHGCNVILGFSGESIDTLRFAIEYLRKHRLILMSSN